MPITNKADPAFAYVCGREWKNGFPIHNDNTLMIEAPLTSWKCAIYQSPLKKASASSACIFSIFQNDTDDDAQ